MLNRGECAVLEQTMSHQPGQLLTHRRDPAGGWELVSGRPDARLRGAVHAYEGYLETMPQPVRRRELPAAQIALIINFGPPYRLLDPADPDDAARAIEQRGGFVAGLDDRYAITESTGAASCLQINFAPLAAFRLFARPMSDLARQVVALSDLLGSEAELLTEQLATLPDWTERFALLDRVIARRLDDGPMPSPEIVWAWRQLTSSGGRVAIGTLSDELGWSSKQLIARFREQVGLPPKQSARLLRFQRAVAEAGGGTGDWSAFAQRHGYCDQAHLINEFRRFAGDTPAGIARRRMPHDGGYAEARGE
jgi:AraC-like DNA-binding protein